MPAAARSPCGSPRSTRSSRSSASGAGRRAPARLITRFAGGRHAFVVKRVAFFRFDERAPVGSGMAPLPAVGFLVRHMEYFAGLHAVFIQGARRPVGGAALNLP